MQARKMAEDKIKKADQKKALGNEAFSKKDYATAIKYYSEAIELDPTNHVYFSNRSACYNALNEFVKGASDGEECIKLENQFVKGYHRWALALKGLQKYDEALEVLKRGQKIDFNNKDFNSLTTEIEALLKNQKMAARKSMNVSERLKEEGNDWFKSARYDLAIDLYTKALDSMSDKKSALALSCYNNRGACYQQLSNYSALVRDSTLALEIEPKNQKALLRRALAYEGLEKYRLALQDIRTLLAENPNIEIANKAQHRIGAAVRALKEPNQNDF